MTKYLELPGTNNNWASAPQSTDFDLVAGEVMRYEIRVGMTDWTPSGDDQAFITSWEAGDQDFVVRIAVTSGAPQFFWGPGSAGQSASAAPGFTDEAVRWLAFEVTPESSPAAGDGVVTFEKSSDNTNDPTAVSWTQISTHTSLAVTVNAHSNVAGIGAQSDGADDMLAGNLYQVKVLRDTIMVAHFLAEDFNVGDTDTDTAVGAGGHTWTLHGAGVEIKDDIFEDPADLLTLGVG